MLTREQFCLLTNIDNNTLKNRVKRGLLPFFPTQRERGNYKINDAFLTILCDTLAAKRNLVVAAEVVGRSAKDLSRMRAELKRTSAPRRHGADDILVAKIDFNMAAAEPHMFFCGTKADVCKALMSEPASVIDITVASATKAAAVLRWRAVETTIDISSFWLET